MKLIASGDTRDTARARALAAIRCYPILGIRTNIPLLIELLEHPKFVSGNIDTGLLDADGDAIEGTPVVESLSRGRGRGRRGRAAGPPSRLAAAPRALPDIDPWSSLRGARV